MRKEAITFNNDLPVKISLEKITDYPIHWHNSMEIIFVLKGSINAILESSEYVLKEKSVEIINPDEAHKFYATDEDNLVLIFHFDQSFFEKYYHDMDNTFFYTTLSEPDHQEQERDETLRELLSILACELIQKNDDYDDAIENTTVKLLFHLINNYHYLIYDDSENKVNSLQFKRYHRITKFIYNNYYNKISLSDIAEQEFLSSYYLSHEIKNMSGLSFKDFLNMIRVDESVKLLLGTDKTILDISEEVGFSHSRYYNKHFKKHYKITPLQYRKKYYLTPDKYEAAKKFTELPLSSSVDLLSKYLENYERFNYENKIIKLSINTADEGSPLFHSWTEIINLGDAFEILKSAKRSYVETLQNNMHFKYGLVEYLFHKDMKIYFNNNVDFLNWNEVEGLLDALIKLNIIPMIVVDKVFDNIEYFSKLFKSFLLYFFDLYDYEDIAQWKFRPSSNLPKDYIIETNKILKDFNLDNMMEEPFTYEDKVSHIYDLPFMIPYIIHSYINNKPLYNIKAFDVVDETTPLKNELFFGYCGMLTLNGIRKPSYYGLYLLSLLGDEVISKGDGYIVTKSNEDFQVLLYSYDENLSSLKVNKNISDKKISLTLSNLMYDYKVTKYEIGEKHGSSYNHWITMGKPKRLTDEEFQMLNRISFPDVTLSYSKKTPLLNMIIRLQGYSACLILLKKVQKHLF